MGAGEKQGTLNHSVEHGQGSGIWVQIPALALPLLCDCMQARDISVLLSALVEIRDLDRQERSLGTQRVALWRSECELERNLLHH